MLKLNKEIKDNDLLKIHLLSSADIHKDGFTVENYNKIVKAINLLDCIDLTQIDNIIYKYFENLNKKAEKRFNKYYR